MALPPAQYTAQMAFLGLPETKAKVKRAADLRQTSQAEIVRECVEAQVDKILARAERAAEKQNGAAA